MKKPPRRNQLLRQARHERGWTQRHLARELGVQEQTVGSWEHGTRFPSLELRSRLCDIFSKTPEQLGLQPTDRDEKTSQQLSLPTALPSDPTLPFVLEVGVVDTDAVQPWQGVPSRFVPNQADENRQRMLKRVRSRWITGVLERSLYRAALIILGLREQPDAVENPWRLAVAESDLPPRLLPAGTRITQVYDEADGELLILGEPGAGKTTLLLELARDLLFRAGQDQSHPIPVIFNLSSWAVKQHPLAQWLAEELHTKYRVPRKVGQGWIDTNQLLVLLDGLDEVAEAARSACVKAINAYQQAYELVPIVVCCRRAEYFVQATRVALQQAVLVQPLTQQQIEEYLCSAGEQLEAVRQALSEDPEFQEMVKTPLMLSIVALAYQGEASAADVPAGSIEARRQQVFATYVQRMLRRRGADTRYTEAQAKRWLAWLARQLARHSQTEFYLERLQPDWLDNRSQQHHRNTVVRLIYGLYCCMVAGLLGWLRGGWVGNVVGVGAGLLGQLGAPSGNKVLGWMAPGLGGGLGGGGTVALVYGIVTLLVTMSIGTVSRQTPFPQAESWTRRVQRSVLSSLKYGLLSSIIIGVLAAGVFALSSGLGRLYYGAGFGLFCGLIVGALSGMITGLGQNTPSESRRSGSTRLADGMTMGVCAWLSFAVVNGWFVGFDEGVIYGAVAFLLFGVVFSWGHGTDLIRGLGTEIQPAELVAWSFFDIRRDLPHHIGKGLITGLAITVSVVVLFGLASALFHGITHGLAYGLVFGPIIGVVVAVAGILTAILNSGWSSKLLEEHQLARPNDGIRHSLRNAAFVACLFGPIGGLVSGFVCGGAFGFIGGLSGWPILGIGFGIVFTFIFAFAFAVIRGGAACIEHYLLRWRLWRAGYTPKNYIRFLDYAAERILLRKVGGGYLFAHRLLLDYFAALDRSQALSGEDPSQLHSSV